MLARATRSALVSMAGAAERAVVDTVVVGAIGAKDRADEASIMVLGRRRLGKDGARSGKLSGGERHRLPKEFRNACSRGREGFICLPEVRERD